jgi:antitoxin component YwqK of YwqJK toxin-antitoxin module
MNAGFRFVACVGAALALSGSGGGRSAWAAGSTELVCPDGTVRRERPTDGGREIWCGRLDGTRHGPYRSLSHQLRTEGAFVDGKMNGPWRIWSGDTLVSEIHYERGVEQGPWLSWTREGRAETRGRTLHGKRSGVWHWWYPSGRSKYTGVYTNDLEEGRHTEWTEDGKVMAEGSYSDGKKVGRWVESDGWGSAGRGSYARGERTGRWTFFFQHDPSAVGGYHRGKREGEWTFYFPGGGVSERGAYRAGKKDGRWVFSGGEGKRETIVDCRQGQPHGQIIRHTVEGGAQLEGRFLAGEMDGAWTERAPDGTITRAVYRQGELVGGDRMDEHAEFARTLCQEESHDYRVIGDARPE